VQTEFAGNTLRLETIELPADVLAAINTNEPMAAAEDGETGDEVGEVTTPTTLPPSNNATTPTPTLTPEIDDEGTVIPRAVPVAEP
jgi:hypothetical protein